jgi:hypothetical protein
MSDKLIIEFYSSDDATMPVACVLASHGGDNPSSAATTLSDFFEALSCSDDARFDDAGLLAARFVAWKGLQGSSSLPFDFIDVSLVPFEQNYGCQVARVYARSGEPDVQFVRDEWTTDREMVEAAMILGHGVLRS